MGPESKPYRSEEHVLSRVVEFGRANGIVADAMRWGSSGDASGKRKYFSALDMVLDNIG